MNSKNKFSDFTNPMLFQGVFNFNILEERQTKIETNIEHELKLITNEIANKQLNQFLTFT